MFKKIMNLVPKSVTYVSEGGVSSSRIQSYGLLILIYIITIFIVVSETIAMVQHGNSEVSMKMMTWGGMLLAHHIALLGINKNSKAEPKYNEMLKNLNPENKGDNPPERKLLNEEDMN